MYQHICGYLRPNKEIENAWDYTELDVMDMGGYFPARLMNMMLASTVKSEVRKFYNAIRTDKEKKK